MLYNVVVERSPHQAVFDSIHLLHFVYLTDWLVKYI